MPAVQTSLVEFFFASWVSGGVNALLALLGLAALVSVWSSWRRAGEAIASLMAVSERWALRPRDATSPDELAAPARLAAIIAAEAPESYLRDRLTLVKAIDAEGDRPNPDLLTAKVVAQIERELWLPKWVASASVLLGLLGTLIGLSLAVAKLTPLVEQPEKIAEALIGVFGGLTTAFSTTLAGIVVAIPLGWALAYTRDRQTAFVTALEDFSQQHIYPLYQTSPEASLERTARTLKRLETEQRKAFEAVSKQLNEMLAAIESRGTTLTRRLVKSGTALKQELQTTSSELAKAVAATGITITGRVDRLLARQAELLGPEATKLTSFAELAEELRSAASQVQALAEEVDRVVPSLEEAIARQVEQQTRDLRETMQTYTLRMADGVERHEHGVESQLGRLAGLLTELDRKLVASLAAHEQALVDRLAPAGDELRRAVAEATTVNQGVGRSGAVLAQLIDRVEFGLLRVQDVMVQPEPIDADRVVGAIEVLGARIAELKPILAAAISQPGEPRPALDKAGDDDATAWAAELLRQQQT